MQTIQSDLLQFREEERENDTAVMTVLAKAKGVILGQIRWHRPYRSFAFTPAADVSLTHRALTDISRQLVALSDDRARHNGVKPRHGKPQMPTRCGAIQPGPYVAPGDADAPLLVRCGRWLGHSGPHRQMGSTETWEG